MKKEYYTANDVIKTAKEEKTDDDLYKSYVKWLQDKNLFSAVGDVKVEEKIKTSVYRIVVDQFGRIFFERMKPKTAELYRFKSGPMEEVLSEIDKFWGLKQDYKDLGLLYSRGILLYGPPGSGKTSIINQLSEMITQKKGDIVIYANGSSLNDVKSALRQLRSVEEDRNLVVILEDADEFLRYSEESFLHLLDGQDSIEGVLWLGTTNYIDRFPQRLLRSGRFDRKIYIPMPPYEGRLAYFQNKLKPAKKATDKEIENLANETDGFSFGDLLEVVTAVYALKEPKDKVISRLKKSEEKTGIIPADSQSSYYPSLLSGPKAVKANGNIDIEYLKKMIKK